MAEIPFVFTSQGDDDILRSLSGIVGLSKDAQEAVGSLAREFGISASQAQKLITEFNRLRQSGRSEDQIFRVLQQELGVTSRQFERLVAVSALTRKEFDRLGGATRKAGDQINQTNRRLGALTTLLQGIGQGIGQQAVNLLASAFNRLGQEIGRTIETAIEFDSIVRVLGRSTADGQATFRELIDSANALGVEFEQVLPQFIRLTEAASTIGLPFEETQRLFENVSRAVSELGISGLAVDSIFRALSQIIGKNRVQAEEIRQQLAEAFPPAIGLAQQALGAFGAEFDELLRRGVSATEFIPAFSDELERNFSGAADTSAAALARFNNALAEVRNEFGQEFVDGLVEVTAVFIENKDAILDLAAASGQAASGGLKLLAEALAGVAEAAEGVRVATQFIEIDGGELGLTTELVGLRDVFEDAGGSAADFNELVRQVIEDLGGLSAVTELGPARIPELTDSASAQILQRLSQAVEEQIKQQAELGAAQAAAAEERQRAAQEEVAAQQELEQAQRDRADQEKEDRKEVQSLIKEEQQLTEDVIESETDSRLEALEKVSDARIKSIEDAADQEEKLINERLETERIIGEARLEEAQKAEQQALSDRLEATSRAVELELAVREGGNRVLLQREEQERKRIEEEINRLRSGQFLDRDSLELAQEILFPSRSPQQLQFINEDDLRAIQELLPEIEQAQQAGITENQRQQRLAFEALLQTQEFLAQQEIFDLRQKEAEELQQAQADFEEQQRILNAQSEIAILALEAESKQEQRDLDEATAEQLAQLRIDTAQRVAAIEAQNLAALTAAATPTPRFTGGPMVPGQTYSFAEKGPELLQMGGKEYLFTQPVARMQVPSYAKAVPLAKGAGSSSILSQLVSIDRGIKNLTEMVAQRPIEPQVHNEFVNSTNKIADMVQALRAQNRTYRGKL